MLHQDWASSPLSVPAILLMMEITGPDEPSVRHAEQLILKLLKVTFSSIH